MDVIKRDGRTVRFDKGRIYTAIVKAARDIDKETQTLVNSARRIANEIQGLDRTLNVEEIQDLVEEKLMASSHKEVARAYICYRYLHKMARSQYDELMNAVAEKLMATNVVNQNANIDEHSFGGRIGEASSVVTRSYALKYLLSPKARDNHINNRIYTHDLDHWAVGDHNCLSMPIDDLLANGFTARQTDIRPAQSVSCASQLVAVLFQLQSLQQFGGVSATHLDWTMVPYVRKSFAKHFAMGLRYAEGLPLTKEEAKVYLDKHMSKWSIEDERYQKYQAAYCYANEMLEDEVYQSAEALYHNLNEFGRLNSNVKNIAA